MRGGKSKRPARPTKPRARKPASTVAKVVKSVIKEQIQREIETKYIGYNQSTNYSLTQNSATIPSMLNYVLPNLAQGVGDNDRIGDKIHPVKLRGFFSFYFNPAISTTGNAEVYVNLMVLTSKTAKSYPLTASLTSPGLLKSGFDTVVDPGNIGTTASPAAPTTSYNNSYLDHYPVNTEQWNVLHRERFLMRKNTGIASNNNTGYPNTYGTSAVCKQLTIPVPARIQYSVGSSVEPTNFAPVWVAWMTSADGAQLDANTQIFCATRFDMFFKDA